MIEQSLQNISILVTGGSGFIGSHLVATLLTAGSLIYAPHRGLRPPWRLAEWSNHPRLKLLPNCDLRSRKDVEELVVSIDFQSVAHTAAYGVQAREHDIGEAVSVNVLGTTYLIDACRDKDIKRFVLIGTGFEYQEQIQPIDEAVPLQSGTAYGASKTASWLIADYYRREKNFPLVTLRPFATYGPKEDETKLIPHVICSALRNEPIKISNGHQLRDYTYVTDVVSAISMALAGRLPLGEVYNVTAGESLRVAEIAELARQLVAKDVELQLGSYQPLRKDHRVLVGCADKLRQYGWAPQYTLTKGLIETIDWYTNNLKVVGEK
ncbi:MAG: NAD(P)-dependent oxidoreductase [Acidobacteriota bacterium]